MDNKLGIIEKLFNSSGIVRGSEIFLLKDGTPTKLTDVEKTKFDLEYEKYQSKDKVAKKNQAIEDYIYSKYTQTKQAQDAGWVANFTTKLVAGGVLDLDEQIVNFTFLFYEGKTLKEILIDIDDAVKPMYEKLVKVAVKNEWAYNCIQAGKKAITDNTEAVYPAFPVFE